MDCKTKKTENLYLVVKSTVNSTVRAMKCYENVLCSGNLKLLIIQASGFKLSVSIVST